MSRILVVDDRAENRDLLAYLLRYHGHTVALAPDGAAAVLAALADPPDLVLMDIAMPGIDGLAAARQMRSHPTLADTPLVAISATGTITPETTRASGFDAFYPIPIDPAYFVAQLDPFLTGPHTLIDRQMRRGGSGQERGSAAAPNGDPHLS